MKMDKKEVTTMAATPGVIAAQGTTFKKGVTTVGYLKSIGGLEVSRDTIDASDLSSTWKTFVGSIADGGEVSLSGNFEPGQHLAFYTDLSANTIQAYSIEFPIQAGGTVAPKWAFSGLVTSVKTNAEMGDLVGFETTIKISGTATLTGGS